MVATLPTQVMHLYEAGVNPARKRFATDSGIATLISPEIDPVVSQLFFLQFCSLGVALTEPVEGWIARAGKRCREIGLTDLGQALAAHAKAESGHHLMMIKDTQTLVAWWNAHRQPLLDAERLLARTTTVGGRMYQKVHEDNIAGDTPFAQIAIEFEIEQLPLNYGAQLLEAGKQAFGRAAISGLSFIDEHVTLDIGHTKFNTRQLERVLEEHPAYLEPLVRAGASALDAYGTFLSECLHLAQSIRQFVDVPE